MMGKKWRKRLIAVVLIVIMVLPMAACSKKKEENPNADLAKQFVFSNEEIAMPEIGDDFYMSSMAYFNDRIYLIAEITYYSGNPNADEGGGDGTEESGEEGSDAGVAPLSSAPYVGGAIAVPDIGVEEPETEWVEPYYETALISMNMDGSDLQKTVLHGLDGSSESNGSAYTNVYFNRTKIGGDGRVYAVKVTSVNDNSDPNNYYYSEESSLIRLGQDGEIEWETPLYKTDSQSNTYYYVEDLSVNSDGISYVTVYGDDKETIWRVDTAGSILGKQELSGEAFTNVRTTFLNSDGTMSILSYSEDYSSMYYTSLNLDTGVTSEKKKLPDNINNYNSMLAGPSGTMLMTSNTGIFSYNFETGETEQIMNYINSDMNTYNLQNITFIDDEHFLASYTDYSQDYKRVVAKFTRVAPEDIVDKTVLVFGCTYFRSDYRTRIVDFNKKSDRYRIVVKDYSQYNTMGEGGYVSGAETQLNNDIISGNMPDILLAAGDFSMLSIANYASMGLLADVGALIEQDEELSKLEFLQNVFDAYSIDGTLYFVIPSFNVQTLVGKTSLLGDRTGWNMEEFQQVMSQMPEGTSAFGELTQGGFLSNLLTYCGTQFVNEVTGECSFDSPEFVKMLEFAKTLPAEYSYDEDYDWSLYETQYRENRTLLSTMYLSDFSDLNYTINATFGEDITFIGFPNEERNGSIVDGSSNLLVLSSQSADLDGAWEFARYYLTDEYQKGDNFWAFSTRKDIFLEKAQEAIKPSYYLDEQGNPILDENGNPMEQEEYYWVGDEQFPLTRMTQEQLDKAIAFVESVSRLSYYNEDIYKILQEETAPFFQGQKSAQEVADIIQSKVKIMVNESK